MSLRALVDGNIRSARSVGASASILSLLWALLLLSACGSSNTGVNLIISSDEGLSPDLLEITVRLADGRVIGEAYRHSLEEQVLGSRETLVILLSEELHGEDIELDVTGWSEGLPVCGAISRAVVQARSFVEATVHLSLECDPADEDSCFFLNEACIQGVCDESRACILALLPEGTECSTGEYCFQEMACNPGGRCVGLLARDCSHLDDLCTMGRCDEEARECVETLRLEGTPCGDELWCDVEGQCSGYCLVDESSYLAGTINPENECLWCQPALSTRSWSSRDEASCNSGDPLAPGTCREGDCVQEGGASCPLPWGGQIRHDTSVLAFETGSTACGQSCPEPETRHCSDGVLSGSFTSQNCVASLLVCTPSEVRCDQDNNIEQCDQQGCAWNFLRQCADGARCENGSCGEGDPSPCQLPWGGQIPHQSSVYAHQVASVECGDVCPDPQTRFCDNGELSGSHQYAACSAEPQICSPGQPRCQGDNLERCSHDGCGWQVESECSCGCNVILGACNPSCIPLTFRCNAAGTHREQCTSLGCGWTPIENCGDGKPCTVNSCQNGYCTSADSPAGESCDTDRVCDGSGNCVDPGTANCPSQTVYWHNNCVPGSVMEVGVCAGYLPIGQPGQTHTVATQPGTGGGGSAIYTCIGGAWVCQVSDCCDPNSC